MPDNTQQYRVYSASAGAGKTFSLVREYLVLCLRNDDPRTFARILAITFTNKAAAEMKRRVLQALDGFQRDITPKDQAGLFSAVRDELSIGESVLRHRAQRALKTLLHDYSSLSIGTIDQFNYRLVRTFSHDLGLSSNFEVEMDTDELMRQTVDLLLDKTGIHDKLTDSLERYTKRNMNSGKSWNPEFALREMARELTKERSIGAIGQLSEISLEAFAGIRLRLEKRQDEQYAVFNKLANRGRELIEGLEDCFAYGAVPGYFEKLMGQDPVKFDLGKRLSKMLEDEDYTTKSAPAHVTQSVEPISGALSDLLRECARASDDLVPVMIMTDAVLSRLDATAVLHEMERTLHEYKTANNIEPIYTFNQLIHKSIAELPTPYVYERIGERYRHYFVDEFQDTSRLQWKNLIPLVHNAVSSGGTTMVVGDAKQSIYRWRGGEAEQFLELIGQARNPELKPGDLGYAMEHIALDANWRSCREIVAFNNRFFEFAARQLTRSEYQSLYAEAGQIPKGKAGGYVEFRYFDREDKEMYTRNQLDEVINRITDLRVNQGYSFRDIAVLTRKNQHGELIVSALAGKDIPVVSAESLKLSNASSVRALVAALRLLIYPEDAETRVEFLRFMRATNVWQSTPEEWHETMVLAIRSEGTAWLDFLNQHGWQMSPAEYERAGLYECGERVARTLGLIGDDRTSDPFIQFFLDELFSFSGKNTDNLSDFIQWWDLKGHARTISVPDEMDAVQVMTIHKAKGLEFPVVVLPFVDWEATSDRRATGWLPLNPEEFEGLPVARVGISRTKAQQVGERYPEYAELVERYNEELLFDNLNLLYVAMTRPVERLYVYPGIKEKKKENSTISNFIDAFLNEYDTEPAIGSVHEFGEALHHMPESEEHETVDQPPDPRKLQHFVSLDWRQRVRLSRKIEGIDDELSEQPRRWGNMVHDLLGRMHGSEDIPAVLNRASAEGRLPEVYRTEMQQLLEQIVHHPELAHTFNADQVFTEREILAAEGILRPDRISRKGDAWVIVDYKTGAPRQEHHRQVERYVQALGADGKAVSGYLVYIGPQDVLVERIAP